MVSVTPGGEPERDDTGLPPVDIEIPDDARELDRDVQAYYRELRAERRRQRRRRLGVPGLARDGIVLPLLACCMILALITGTLLTVFTTTSDQSGPTLPRTPGAGSAARNSTSRPASTTPSGSASASASGSASPAVTTAATDDAVHAAAPAPALTLTAVSDPDVTIPVDKISGSMLVLIPLRCRCTAALHRLTAVAAATRAPVYYIATPATQSEVGRLYGKLRGTLASNVIEALDDTGKLAANYPARGLTAILIASPQLVSTIANISISTSATAIRQALIA